MRFRPEDQYCKPSIARSNKTSNLLLKVKRRCIKTKLEEGKTGEDGELEGVSEKSAVEAMEVGNGEAGGKGTAQDAEGNGGQEEYKYSVELLGFINTTYQFSGNVYQGCL